MTSPGEHVHSGDIFQRITKGIEAQDISGQGGGVAGDVHDALRRHGGDGGDGVLAHALSGRVDHNRVRLQPPFGKLGGGLSRVGADKFRVADAVHFGVLFCVFNGLRYDFRADDLPGPLCKAQGYGARAAVQVENKRILGGRGIFHSSGVQLFRLGRIDLEKSLG